MVLRLPDEIEQRLARLARQTGRTKTSHAREAILAYLEELEDLHLARKRLATPANRWSHEDMEADVDLVQPGTGNTAEARPPTA